jgi:hypothetical protein
MGIALSVPAAAGAARATSRDGTGSTTTPIQHLVVIFQRTSPSITTSAPTRRLRTPPGSRSTPRKGTPKVNNLANTPGAGGTGTLLTNNPNQDAGGHQVNPRPL